jgi:hypothetical protein
MRSALISLRIGFRRSIFGRDAAPAVRTDKSSGAILYTALAEAANVVGIITPYVL